MINDLFAYVPHENDPLRGIVHRMAHVRFRSPLPPERLTPDSFITHSLVLEGGPRYFNGQGVALDRHDGFSGHVLPEQGIVVSSPGPLRSIMTSFFPSAFHKLFGGPLAQFNGQMVPHEQVLGGVAATLCAELRATPDPEEAIHMVKRHLLALIPRHAPDPPSPIAQVEQRIRQRNGMVQVNELADLAGLSERQLQRRFKEEIGLSPKAFCQVVRFNHLRSEMKRKGELNLDLALSCGYFDESHMLKDLSYYLGKNPKRVLSLIHPMVDLNLEH